MSFKFGGGKSKGSTSSTETFNKTSTPVVPDWIMSATQGLSGKVQELAGANPYDLVPGHDWLQGKAYDTAKGLGGDTKWLDDLMGASAPTVGAASLLDNLDDYQNPYRKNVTDAAMADFDFEAGKTRAQQDLDLAGNQAFGGSGMALTKSATEEGLSRARNSQLSKLLSDMFTTSAGLSGQDADRRQSASAANASLALQDRAQKASLGFGADANQRANVGAQMDIGGVLRDITTQQKQAPFDLAEWAISALGGLNPGLFIGENSQGTSSGTGTSKGKTSNWGMDVSAADIGKLIAGMG